MNDLRGAGVSPGVGVGPVRRLAGDVVVEPEAWPPAGDPDAEGARAAEALAAVAAELEQRGARAGGDAAAVLAAQAMMARDPELADEVGRGTAAGASAARAVHEAFEPFRRALAGAGDYVAARVADLDDVRGRVLARLLGLPAPGLPESAEPYVLIARDLAPADTALLDPAKVLAFVTEEGGPTSHTAIIARSLGVPAVVACAGATSLPEGVVVLVDGDGGRVRVAPPEEDVRAARAARGRAEAAGPGATADGVAVPLLANVGGPRDVEAAAGAGAEGVGLYRTEFLFLGRSAPPSQEEQVAAYRAALAAFPGGRVVVRVLDAGADKPLGFLPPPTAEPNPALGERGLRLLRRHPQVLAGQLRALARAAEQVRDARPAVMAPMVADAAEARWFATACREAGLDAEIGVMVEIPSAALRAGDLVAEVDFLSLGTNDLAQYAFAADRQVGALADLQDPWRPALLDLVALAASAARRVGRGCGVCGEAAADPALACVLVGLGVTSLSMGAAAIPSVRAALARHTLEGCARAATAAREAATGAAARAAAHRALDRLA